jgi:hypothetical protein
VVLVVVQVRLQCGRAVKWRVLQRAEVPVTPVRPFDEAVRLSSIVVRACCRERCTRRSFRTSYGSAVWPESEDESIVKELVQRRDVCGELRRL